MRWHLKSDNEIEARIHLRFGIQEAINIVAAKFRLPPNTRASEQKLFLTIMKNQTFAPALVLSAAIFFVAFPASAQSTDVSPSDVAPPEDQALSRLLSYFNERPSAHSGVRSLVLNIDKGGRASLIKIERDKSDSGADAAMVKQLNKIDLGTATPCLPRRLILTFSG